MNNDVREKIAIRVHTVERAIAKVVYESSPINCSWEELGEAWRNHYQQQAQYFINDFQEAGYRQVDEDAKLPENKAWQGVEREFEAYCAGQNDMLRDNWRKVL